MLRVQNDDSLPPMRILTIVLIASATTVTACGDGGPTGGMGGSCLEGAWACMLPDESTAEMTISGAMINGSFAIGPVSATVMSTITVDGSMISVVDTGGTGACPMNQVGEYTFACSDTALDFTLVSDDCVGRTNFLGCDWTQQ